MFLYATFRKQKKRILEWNNLLFPFAFDLSHEVIVEHLIIPAQLSLRQENQKITHTQTNKYVNKNIKQKQTSKSLTNDEYILLLILLLLLQSTEH